jgi:hypothetical protein
MHVGSGIALVGLRPHPDELVNGGRLYDTHFASGKVDHRSGLIHKVSADGFAKVFTKDRFDFSLI